MLNATIFLTFNPLLLKELAMEDFRQEEMSTIGVYGLQLLLFKTTRLQLEDLIVNLVLNLFLFGKLFFNLLIQMEDIMNLNKFNFIRNIQADLIL